MPDTLRYDEENKKTILVDTPFEWNNPISFDTEGRTKGKVCGMRLGWLPEGWGTGYTQTAYDVIAQRDAEQAQSLPQDERELVVYTYDLFAVQDVRKDYSVQCMSADEVAGCDFLCGGSRTEITKQGTIGPYDASWVETHWKHSKSRTPDEPEEQSMQLLLLYDREKLCVVVISAGWDDAERIAEHLEIVETSVDAPQPDLTNGRGLPLDRRCWIVGNGFDGTRLRAKRGASCACFLLSKAQTLRWFALWGLDLDRTSYYPNSSFAFQYAIFFASSSVKSI